MALAVAGKQARRLARQRDACVPLLTCSHPCFQHQLDVDGLGFFLPYSVLRRLSRRKRTTPTNILCGCILMPFFTGSLYAHAQQPLSMHTCALRCFLTVIGKYVPPFTVASFATIMHSNPSTLPIPATTPPAGIPPPPPPPQFLSLISCPANGDSSRNGVPGSTRASILSLASSLPRPLCRLIATSPPPASTRASLERRFSTMVSIAARFCSAALGDTSRAPRTVGYRSFVAALATRGSDMLRPFGRVHDCCPYCNSPRRKETTRQQRRQRKKSGKTIDQSENELLETSQRLQACINVVVILLWTADCGTILEAGVTISSWCCELCASVKNAGRATCGRERCILPALLLAKRIAYQRAGLEGSILT